MSDAAQSGNHAKAHDFTALWWNFGPYGPQDVHVHDCHNERCSYVLIGEGRECSKDTQHYLERLTMSTPKRLLENA